MAALRPSSCPTVRSFSPTGQNANAPRSKSARSRVTGQGWLAVEVDLYDRSLDQLSQALAVARTQICGLLVALVGTVIQERTRISEEDAAALFREAQTKDATAASMDSLWTPWIPASECGNPWESMYAIGCGIVHEIKDVSIPPGSPVVSLVFQR
jgi:hypothetical protein